MSNKLFLLCIVLGGVFWFLAIGIALENRQLTEELRIANSTITVMKENAIKNRPAVVYSIGYKSKPTGLIRKSND